MAEQTVQYPSNGDQASGYLARPDEPGNRPGVIVIQEWWGVNDHIKDVTRRFAKAGFIALAPDLYHGKVVTEPDEGQKAAMELDRVRAMKELDAAVTYLKSLPDVAPKQVGVIGFCMGGGLALHVGAHNPDVCAVVAFYGGGGPDAKEFAKSNAAILNIVGELDQRVTATIKALEEGLKQYSIHHEVIVYPNAQHAFFNDTRPSYKADAAQDAWTRAVTWLHKYLV